MTATGASRARSPTGSSPARNAARSASTACRPRSGASGATYYRILERTQKGTLDVTPWLEWFLICLGRAFDGTEATLAAVLRKARFWERAAPLALNARQRLVLNRLLDGFTGTLTTQKWAALAKSSHDTALRDIQGLIDQGLLKKNEGGGRSTSYSLIVE